MPRPVALIWLARAAPPPWLVERVELVRSDDAATAAQAVAHGELLVSDNGPSVGRSERLRIFHPFVAPGGTNAIPVENLGLALAAARIESAGGTISAASTTTAGLEIRALLPLAVSREAGT